MERVRICPLTQKACKHPDTCNLGDGSCLNEGQIDFLLSEEPSKDPYHRGLTGRRIERQQAIEDQNKRCR